VIYKIKGKLFMNIEFEKLLKKVLLTTLGTSTLNSISDAKSLDLELVECTDLVSYQQFNPDLTQKLLLKFNSDGVMELANHRSHRSHSSHRSHYSSSTSSGSSSGSTSGLSKSSTKDSTTYVLGARTLHKGLSGTDVVELAKLFVKLKYLTITEKDFVWPKTMPFDDLIKGAVEDFQKKNDLTVTGRADAFLILMIKEKARDIDKD
tara:strand:+ start:2311 stop:2928 length:618 start_codon:yes stop_codon:yes gene_type:complete